MKNLKPYLLPVLAVLSLALAACGSNRFDSSEPIDTELIKNELTDAIKQTIQESDSMTADPTIGREDITCETVKDSTSMSGTPVINVYVNIPSHSGDSDVDMDGGEYVAALAVILAFVMPSITIVLIIIAVLVFVYRRNRNRNAVIEQAIRAGYTLPDSFYNGKQSMTKHKDPELLQSAIKLIGIGVLLCVAFMFFFDSPFVGIICLIPAVIGVGRLISYYVASAGENHCNTTDHDHD